MMDLLTDILREAGLQRRLLKLRALDADSAIRFPCDRSIGLHVVTKGQAFVLAPGLAEPILLKAGDIALMARGCTHLVSARRTLDADMPVSMAEPWSRQGIGDREPEPVGTVISGAYQFWNKPVHPFFNDLPSWLVLNGADLPKLGPIALTVGLLDEETRRQDLGAEAIVHALLDVIFTYVLRHVADRHAPAGAGWSHAVADLQIRKAVMLMHEDSARQWTLEDLAASVALSRTAFAERFRAAMGDTPLNYLRTVRVQKAMTILAGADEKLEEVARRVGYQDAFGFSKVFKRIVGVSPGAFRRTNSADRTSPWRMQAGAGL
jgi:AraC-like DNA-binding protein